MVLGKAVVHPPMPNTLESDNLYKPNSTSRPQNLILSFENKPSLDNGNFHNYNQNNNNSSLLDHPINNELPPKGNAGNIIDPQQQQAYVSFCRSAKESKIRAQYFAAKKTVTSNLK